MEDGKTVRSLREGAEMSEEELGRQVLVSRQTISGWENDKSYPDVQSLALISGIFGASIDELVKADLPMIESRPTEEDARAIERDVKDLKRSTAVSIILAIATLTVACIALCRDNWYTLGMCALVYAFAIYLSIQIEEEKKKCDAGTRREIEVFMEGKPFDEIEVRHRPLSLGVSIAGKVLLDSCVGSHRIGNDRIRPFAGSLLIWNTFTE